jgi:hypothetical protein
MILAAALSAVLATTGPEGWTQVPEPSNALLQCANYSKREWRVSPRPDGVRLEREPAPEHDTGGPLPFTLPKELPARGRRHVLAVTDGFLVGFDAGEWGGALFWLSSNGRTWRRLSEENVHGLVSLGPREVLVLQGLNHLSEARGSAGWIKQGANQQWTLSEQKKLDAGPQAFVATRNAVYVATADSLTRIDRDRQVTVLQPLPTATLYPNSMATDSDGALWLGMRHFVLRLVPGASGFSREWLVPKDCTQAEVRKFDCVCVR